MNGLFSIQLGMSSSELTFSPSFFRGVGWNHQPCVYIYGFSTEINHPATIWLIIWLYKYSPGWNHQPVMIDQRCRSPPEDLNAALDQHLGILGADRDLRSGQKWHEMAQTYGVNIEFRGCTLWRWLVCGDIWDMIYNDIYTIYIYILMNMQSN